MGCAISNPEILQAGSHGIHIQGASHFNQFSTFGSGSSVPSVNVTNVSGFGVFIEDDSKGNSIALLEVQGNLGGIRVMGPGTSGNQIGRDQFLGTGGLQSLKVIGVNGPGILLEAPANQVARVNILRGGGDGLVIGSGSERSRILESYIGLDWENPDPVDPVPDTQIGRAVWIHDVGQTNDPLSGLEISGLRIKGRSDLSVHVENCTGIRWQDSSLEVIQQQTTLGDGLYVRLGSHRNLFTGLNVFHYRDGLVLSGSGTYLNRFEDCVFGFPGLANGTGVRVHDEAWDNHFNRCTFAANDVAGLVLDSGGDPGMGMTIDPASFVPQGGNIVTRSLFGTNQVGLVVGSSARMNVIGGRRFATGNEFTGNGIGLQLDGPAPGLPVLANQIAGNAFNGNYDTSAVTDWDATDRGVEPDNTGIWVRSATRNHVIGGGRTDEGNFFQYLSVGIVLDDVLQNQVTGNRMGSDFGFFPQAQYKAGILLRGASANLIGPDNAVVHLGIHPSVQPLAAIARVLRRPPPSSPTRSVSPAEEERTALRWPV